MPEEITKYQKEWDERRQSNSLGCLILLIIVPLFLLLRNFFTRLPDYFSVIFFIAFMLALLISMFFDKGGWKCPRCGQDFDYRRRMVPTKKCIECSLPIYYGSSHFYDYWGSERGNDLAQKVKEGKL
jgi:hypothetical protein